IAATPATDRAVRAVWPGVPDSPGHRFPALDRAVRPEVASILHREPFAAVVFRETTVGGALVDLGAIDGLRRWVGLRSGRFPRPCRPSSCEVLQMAGAGRLPARAGRLRLVRFGTGTLPS